MTSPSVSPEVQHAPGNSIAAGPTIDLQLVRDLFKHVIDAGEVLGVDADLRKARVFYTVLGEERDHRATRAALRSARSHLRAVVGHEIRIKVTPELEFEEDDWLDRGQRIEEIIEGLHADDPGSAQQGG